jgi:ABC-type nickel/cobalt efflux system permease component RcnA
MLAPVTGAEQRVEADGPSDRDRGGGADRPRVGRHGHDHEHEERGHDGLVDERAAGADARHGGSQRGGLIRPDRDQQRRAEDPAHALRPDIRKGVPRREWRDRTNATVTAGLMCAPDRCPVAYTMTVMISPKTSATPTLPSAPS